PFAFETGRLSHPGDLSKGALRAIPLWACRAIPRLGILGLKVWSGRSGSKLGIIKQSHLTPAGRPQKNPSICPLFDPRRRRGRTRAAGQGVPCPDTFRTPRKAALTALAAPRGTSIP